MKFTQSMDDIRSEATDHLIDLWDHRQNLQAELDEADAAVNDALYQITSRKILTYAQAGECLGFKDSSAFHRAKKAKAKVKAKA